jgi:hypothetical protein
VSEKLPKMQALPVIDQMQQQESLDVFMMRWEPE